MVKYFSLLACLLLWGCGAGQVPETSAPPEGVAEEKPPVPVSETIPEPIPAEPPKAQFAISTLIGLGPETVKNILGEPALLRLEKQAEVWLYRNVECVMHLFFYDNENGDPRLDYLETSALDLTAENPTVSPVACLNSHVPDQD